MRMAWWIFIVLVSIQTILIQYMLETYQAGHTHLLPYYLAAMVFMLVLSWFCLYYFRKVDETQE